MASSTHNVCINCGDVEGLEVILKGENIVEEMFLAEYSTTQQTVQRCDCPCEGGWDRRRGWYIHYAQ